MLLSSLYTYLPAMPTYEYTTGAVDFYATSKEAAHTRYGFGFLKIGESLVITPQDENIVKIRTHLGAHGQYHDKKFKTRTVDGKLHVLRIK
jgi:hypothetical protein